MGSSNGKKNPKYPTDQGDKFGVPSLVKKRASLREVNYAGSKKLRFYNYHTWAAIFLV